MVAVRRFLAIDLGGSKDEKVGYWLVSRVARRSGDSLWDRWLLVGDFI
jgi:hypothetical protein